jgi:delta 1-pyrroline-5-carboxylate dehydrogenase
VNVNAPTRALHATAELDRRMIELEGDQLAGTVDEKELKRTAGALQEAKQRASEDRGREIEVAARAITALETQRREFCLEHAAEIRRVMDTAVREATKGVGAAVNEVVNAVGALHVVDQRYSEADRLLGGTGATPRRPHELDDLRRQAKRLIEAGVVSAETVRKAA